MVGLKNTRNCCSYGLLVYLYEEGRGAEGGYHSSCRLFGRAERDGLCQGALGFRIIMVPEEHQFAILPVSGGKTRRSFQRRTRKLKDSDDLVHVLPRSTSANLVTFTSE